ncbi:MAG: MoaD/ThiS family protein [Acidiferrobacteraceae bacterium]
MSLQVKYFASLREMMGRDGDTLDDVEVVSVAEIWSRIAGDRPQPANMLVAGNQEIADLRGLVRDGDEVAFLPPVTGG